MRELSIPNVARTPAAALRADGFDARQPQLPAALLPHRPRRRRLTDSMVRVHLFATLQRAGIRVAEPQRTIHASVSATRRTPRPCGRASSTRRAAGARRRYAFFATPVGRGRARRGRRAAAVRALRARRRHHQAGQHRALALHRRLRRSRGGLRAAGGPPHVIGTVHAGQFFGEMALLSGDARSATVIAKTDVECYRLDRASFQDLLSGPPRDRRGDEARHGRPRPDLDTARQAFARAAAGRGRAAPRQPIRRFFGIAVVRSRTLGGEELLVRERHHAGGALDTVSRSPGACTSTWSA